MKCLITAYFVAIAADTEINVDNHYINVEHFL